MNEHDHLLDRAVAQLGHGNYYGAIEGIRHALTHNPDSARGHALLAICLHAQKRLYAAEYEAKAALALDPDLGLCHYAGAMVELAHRRFDSAELHLQAAIALQPYNAVWLRELSRLYSLSGKQTQVMPLLERARELDPEDPDTWAALSSAYREQRNFVQAEENARRGLEIDPENTQALLAMGYLLLRQDKVEEAREHAVLVLNNNASNEEAIYLLAQVKARKSLFLGLWWKFNSFIDSGSMARRVMWLVVLFLVYRIVVIAANGNGSPQVAQLVRYLWLGFCIYTWIGPALFRKQLQQELNPVRLNSKY
jgi:tetratricopeptide (TPR) repeat protein